MFSGLVGSKRSVERLFSSSHSFVARALSLFLVAVRTKGCTEGCGGSCGLVRSSRGCGEGGSVTAGERSGEADDA